MQSYRNVFLLGLALYMLVFNLIILPGSATGFTILNKTDISTSLDFTALMFFNIVIIALFSLSYYNWEHYNKKYHKN